MRKYGIMHPIAMSFSSKEFYRDVAKNWGFASFVYLLILVILCSIPVLIKINSGVNEFMDIYAKKVIDQFPTVTMKNGELSIDKPSPYSIKDPDGKINIIVFDTAGQFSSPEDADARVLVTNTAVIMAKSDTETRTYDLSEIKKDFSFGKEAVSEWAGYIKYSIYIIAPIIWIWVYLVRILQALLLALVGLIFVKILKSGLTYGKLIIISIMANTPAIIIKTLLWPIGISIPHWWMLGLIISCGYLFFAVRCDTISDTVPPGPVTPEPNIVS